MSLPLQISTDKDLQLLQTKWKAKLDPLLASPMAEGIFLKSVFLVNGSTKINHLLSRMQQGWMITDINGAAQVYRSQPFNAQTLTLTSNAPVTVNLFVF